MCFPKKKKISARNHLEVEILSHENTPMIGTQGIQLESFKFESWGCKSEVYKMKERYISLGVAQA